MRPSHFHCVYTHNGERQEVEGGFTNFPVGWQAFTPEQKEAWCRELAVAWGMPPDAEIVDFRIAG